MYFILQKIYIYTYTYTYKYFYLKLDVKNPENQEKNIIN